MAPARRRRRGTRRARRRPAGRRAGIDHRRPRPALAGEPRHRPRARRGGAPARSGAGDHRRRRRAHPRRHRWRHARAHGARHWRRALAQGRRGRSRRPLRARQRAAPRPCRRPRSRPRAPAFASSPPAGIGGVHRGDSGDVSSDLTTLAREPVAVVSAGCKAILDLPRTLEMLETLAVPVLGVRTNEFPAFYTYTSGLPLEHRVETAEDAAQICRAHWSARQRRHPHRQSDPARARARRRADRRVPSRTRWPTPRATASAARR